MYVLLCYVMLCYTVICIALKLEAIQSLIGVLSVTGK